MVTIKHLFSDAGTNKTNSDLVRPQDWNSDHDFTMLEGFSVIGTNTSGTLELMTGDSVHFYFDNNKNVDITSYNQINSINAPKGFLLNYGQSLSSYENLSFQDLDPLSINFQGTSQIVSFGVNKFLSCDRLRIPTFWSAGSNTTQASLTAGTGELFFQILTSISFQAFESRTLASTTGAKTNDTLITTVLTSLDARDVQIVYNHYCTYSQAGKNFNQSHSQFISFYNTDGKYTESGTTYSFNGNFSFNSSYFTNFTGMRFMSAPNPLQYFSQTDRLGAGAPNPGAYWLLMGATTQTFGNSEISAVTAVAPRFQSIYGATILNSSVGEMGNSNRNVGTFLGGGIYSNSNSSQPSTIDYTQISSNPSHFRYYFAVEFAGLADVGIGF